MSDRQYYEYYFLDDGIDYVDTVRLEPNRDLGEIAEILAEECFNDNGHELFPLEVAIRPQQAPEAGYEIFSVDLDFDPTFTAQNIKELES